MTSTTETLSARSGSVIDVHPREIVVTQTLADGDYTNVNVINDDDLNVKLSKGGDKIGRHAKDGLVLLALAVDRDHDEVSIELGDQSVSLLESVRRAQAVLAVAEQGLLRVTSGPVA